MPTTAVVTGPTATAIFAAEALGGFPAIPGRRSPIMVAPVEQTLTVSADRAEAGLA
jgi:hypothetical protein